MGENAPSTLVTLLLSFVEELLSGKALDLAKLVPKRREMGSQEGKKSVRCLVSPQSHLIFVEACLHCLTWNVLRAM